MTGRQRPPDPAGTAYRARPGRRVLDSRVLVVTGKGGVGKTTVSTALAIEAARRGRRTLLCETAGCDRVARVFGLPGRSYEPVRLRPGLEALSIGSDEALEDYIVQQVKVRALYRIVFRNRIVGPFMDAVPGLHDVVQLGKVFDLERERDERGRPRWDLLVVDAPATGHGLSLLASPAAMMEMTVAGPFHEGARVVQELFADPERTAIVLVSLPEEMPVNETLDLHARLGEMRRQVRLCVLNEIHPPPFWALGHWDEARRALLAAGRGRLAEAVELVDREVARQRRQARARRRLRGLGPPLVELPFLFRRELGPDDLGVLGMRLVDAR